MQLGTSNKTDQIHASGVLSSSKFTMDVSGKAFRVLSSTLYQNKIGSIVREVSCNAMDAHSAAGKRDVPFIIHLPNDLEPYFSVKDTGVGLSHENISIVYTNVFRSTKDESNDEIGGFGLGSKTPFCYTDNFNITSVYNGTKRHYSAIIQPDGQPFTFELACETTDDPNGVEVSIPVASKDYRQFGIEVFNQLQFFAVKPTIVNGSIEFKSHDEILFDLDSVKIVKNPSGAYDRTWIIQGGVGYPLDYGLILDIVKSDDLSKFINMMRHNNTTLMYFNIGEIEVTASREGISYDARTKHNIVDKFRSIYSQLYTKFETQLDALSNDWQRALLVKDSGTLGRHLLAKNNKWKLPTFNNRMIFNLDKLLRAEKDVTVQTIDPATGVTTDTVETRTYTKFNCIHYGIKRVNTFKSEVKDIEADEKVVIFYNDGCQFVPSRMNAYTIENHNKEKIYILGGFDNAVTDAEALEFSNGIGGKGLVKVSTLPVPPRKPREKREPGDRAAYKIPKLWTLHSDNGYDSSVRRTWLSVTDTAIKNMDDGGVYFVIDDGYTEPVTGSVNYTAFKAMDRQFYAIREKDLKKIAGNDKWIPYGTYQEKFINDIKEKYKNSLTRFAVQHNARDITDSAIGSDEFMNSMYTRIGAVSDPAFRKYVTKYKKSFRKDNVVMPQIMSHFINELFEKEITEIVKKYQSIRGNMHKNLTKKYSLVNAMHNYHSCRVQDYTHVVLYLNAVHGA